MLCQFSTNQHDYQIQESCPVALAGLWNVWRRAIASFLHLHQQPPPFLEFSLLPSFLSLLPPQPYFYSLPPLTLFFLQFFLPPHPSSHLLFLPAPCLLTPSLPVPSPLFPSHPSSILFLYSLSIFPPLPFFSAPPSHSRPLPGPLSPSSLSPSLFLPLSLPLLSPPSACVPFPWAAVPRGPLGDGGAGSGPLGSVRFRSVGGGGARDSGKCSRPVARAQCCRVGLAAPVIVLTEACGESGCGRG